MKRKNIEQEKKIVEESTNTTWEKVKECFVKTSNNVEAEGCQTKCKKAEPCWQELTTI